jgi:pyruvate carboxylase
MYFMLLRYPEVFSEYLDFKKIFGDVSVLDTRTFVRGIEHGEEISIEIEQGKTLYAKLVGIGDLEKDTGERVVVFDLNGHARSVRVYDEKAAAIAAAAGGVGGGRIATPQADPGVEGSVGAPMPGVVVGIKVKAGDAVEKGDALVVLSAMKMETVVRCVRTTGKTFYLYNFLTCFLLSGTYLVV